MIGNSWVWEGVLSCDSFCKSGFCWHGKPAAFFTDPFIIEPSGEVYIQAIKIPLNLIIIVVIIIISPTGFSSLLSHDYITVWYLMGGRGSCTRYRGGSEQKGRSEVSPYMLFTSKAHFIAIPRVFCLYSLYLAVLPVL